MSTLNIRRLDESLKARLRVRAARHGHSMEQEAREILRTALTGEGAAEKNLADAIRKRLAPFGGLELRVSVREPARDPPRFRG